MGFGSEMFGPEDPVDLFAEYLESCALGNADGDEKTELLTDLVVELSDFNVDSNGGDPEAREKSKPSMIYWTPRLKVILCIQLI